MSSVGIDSTPVPGGLAGLAMNGKLLTSRRVDTHPFRPPMSWLDRAALLRTGIKVRMAVMKYAKVSAPRDGGDYRVRQQRIYEPHRHRHRPGSGAWIDNPGHESSPGLDQRRGRIVHHVRGT
ncbi:hypothetical protein [Rhodococcus wratislaviensis]|uniref:hypothetical protein n=1 Tax=Rhodococcus wratislaviensis TaxID=44752 RepID=UPI003646E487